MSKAINVPAWWSTALYVLSAVILSQVVMYLDQARGLAYVLVPIFVFNVWRLNANIKWKTSKPLTLTCYAAMMNYFVLGQMLLLCIISIEKGNPIVASGIAFDMLCNFTTAELCK